MEKIFKNYQKTVRPVKNSNSTLVIYIVPIEFIVLGMVEFVFFSVPVNASVLYDYRTRKSKQFSTECVIIRYNEHFLY